MIEELPQDQKTIEILGDKIIVCTHAVNSHRHYSVFPIGLIPRSQRHRIVREDGSIPEQEPSAEGSQ